MVKHKKSVWDQKRKKKQTNIQKTKAKQDKKTTLFYSEARLRHRDRLPYPQCAERMQKQRHEVSVGLRRAF